VLDLAGLKDTRASSTLEVVEFAAELVLAAAEVFSELDLELVAFGLNLELAHDRNSYTPSDGPARRR